MRLRFHRQPDCGCRVIVVTATYDCESFVGARARKSSRAGAFVSLNSAPRSAHSEAFARKSERSQSDWALAAMSPWAPYEHAASQKQSTPGLCKVHWDLRHLFMNSQSLSFLLLAASSDDGHTSARTARAPRARWSLEGVREYGATSKPQNNIEAHVRTWRKIASTFSSHIIIFIFNDLLIVVS